ncbi:hypothetical protein DFH07DRAFT_768826 [Mycena maculata]|uniref:Uncharacterized protein n=1 Tax=Mycena maculata TaxID=230809 RepID=A0AAD7NQL4_9AGAR|nr:hypothetical protein DFH07DRAFT_768826 [Mycena maculata]
MVLQAKTAAEIPIGLHAVRQGDGSDGREGPDGTRPSEVWKRCADGRQRVTRRRLDGSSLKIKQFSLKCQENHKCTQINQCNDFRSKDGQISDWSNLNTNFAIRSFKVILDSTALGGGNHGPFLQTPSTSSTRRISVQRPKLWPNPETSAPIVRSSASTQHFGANTKNIAKSRPNLLGTRGCGEGRWVRKWTALDQEHNINPGKQAYALKTARTSIEITYRSF